MVTFYKNIYDYFYGKWSYFKLMKILRSSSVIKDSMGVVQLQEWREAVKNL